MTTTPTLRAYRHVHLTQVHTPAPFADRSLATGIDICRCNATRIRFLVDDFRVGKPLTMHGGWHGGRPGITALRAVAMTLWLAAATAFLLAPLATR